ncbi:MAG TPA: hypothetical protein VIC07_05375 [Acidimicrobiia bacterium]
MEETATERHPIRSLFKFLVVIGAVAAVAKIVATKKEEYYGLTESEAREKFESQLGPRIGDDKAHDLADQVIPRLKDSGIVKPDAAEATVEAVKDVASDAKAKVSGVAADTKDMVEDKAKEAGDAIKGAVEEVKKKVD